MGLFHSIQRFTRNAWVRTMLREKFTEAELRIAGSELSYEFPDAERNFMSEAAVHILLLAKANEIYPRLTGTDAVNLGSAVAQLLRHGK